MNVPYSVSPYTYTTMGQAIQAMMSGMPLTPNCFMVTLPVPQGQMYPQLMMNYGCCDRAMMYYQQAPYYGPFYNPQINPYRLVQQPNAFVPYANNCFQNCYQNNNCLPISYIDTSMKNANFHPHSNVHRSSSFNSHMENLSWSRLFGHHHGKRGKQDQYALNYDKNQDATQKRRSREADSGTSTTSDETIRRINVGNSQPMESSVVNQQAEGAFPFKYSVEFVSTNGKRRVKKSAKKSRKIHTDDIFYIKN